MKKFCFISILLFSSFMIWTSFLYASEKVGSVSTKGLLLKDKIEVYAFDDPDIKGITCYTTYYKRGSLNPFKEDSSSVSLSCAKTGKIEGTPSDRENVFSQKKNIFFKKTLVSRLYDKNRNVLIYLTYTKATSGENFSHSISVVPLN